LGGRIEVEPQATNPLEEETSSTKPGLSHEDSFSKKLS